jgi:uncharacterized protein (DUF934 family)
MSVLIRKGQRVEDTYRPLDESSALPSSGHILMSYERWQKERAALVQRGLRVGVKLPNTLDVATADPDLLSADLLVLDFPSFADGRAYSQARLLREARGYRGELRAVGAAVVRDQLLGMVRCGIDSFVLRDDQAPDSCDRALHDFSVAYQPAIDPLPNVRALRRDGTRK